jgi:DNA-binding transcriptional ArsR family regulator
MTINRLSIIFAALADPTRRAILAHLISGKSSVQELAEPFEMSLPGISKHLQVLERAGLIARSREAQRRPCRLNARPLKDASAWLECYRRFWDESFDRLDDYLREIQLKENLYDRKKIGKRQSGRKKSGKEDVRRK